MSAPGPVDPPKTHIWRRRDAVPGRLPDIDHTRIVVPVPAGDVPDPDDLAARVRASLAGWPVVVLRALGTTNAKATPGSWKGRWLRGQIGQLLDATLPPDVAQALLGEHQPGSRISGGAWAPMALRASSLPDGKLAQGTDVRVELVLAGRAAWSAGDLAQALLAPNLRRLDEPNLIDWTRMQFLVCDGDGDPRWKNCGPDERPVGIELDKISEPSLRNSRLMITFQSPAAMARRGEEGEPYPDLPTVVDRIGRTLSTWLKRSKHRGPLLPDADLLRSARDAVLSANHTRIVSVPATLVGAESQERRVGPPEMVASLQGSATWTGDFRGLEPLLRAAAWVGMGPGRQNGLGELTIR